jgi:hypothetical protein
VSKDRYCVSGVSALQNTESDECITNLKCKRLVDVTLTNVESPICWENNCSDFGAVNCPVVGCVVSSESGSSSCLFDECNTYTNVECDERAECVYTFDEGCHKETCSSIESDLESCRMNSKCEVVKGACQTGCPPNACGSEAYCVQGVNMCSYDECSQWESDACYTKEGCIWDDNVAFGGLTGLCKTGTCGSLSRDSCSSAHNHNLCAYVAGSCGENPCSEADCGNEVTSGCALNGDICIVDGCMEYDESGCKSEGVSACVVLESRCVVGECSMLESHSDCGRNDGRCRVVKDKCVENPCADVDCESPACSVVDEQCTYDSCAQYTQEGIYSSTVIILNFFFFVL